MESNIEIFDSCELLSICIFNAVFDMLAADLKQGQHVVNCFQFVYLMRSLTWYSPQLKSAQQVTKDHRKQKPALL